jgi:cysteinyl-tRNA synthetase
MTTLRLYNTLTKTKEDFEPIKRENVRMYVCGPTVYDYAHIGNARPVIVFDVLFRLLRHVYGADHVTYVRNITDVDDKINARAAERHISIRELTDETYAQYKSDVTALGCLPPSEEPRATDYIEVMKEIIEKLRENQHAYVENEHVLFSVPSMPSYGELSRRPLDEMIAGARIDVAPYKRNPMDFVLWKPSDKRSNVSLPSWKSPAGIETPGRPGWHLECSAMSWAKLGQVFDIHGGGIDLIFPHHENEIAQSRCAFHTGFLAKYWMHNGFLEVEGAKMSKSLGNFVTINELLQDWEGEVLRWNMMRTHYRQPIDWTVRSLEESERAFRKWFPIADEVNLTLIENKPTFGVLSALNDDLNTPLVLTELSRLMSDIQDAHDQRAIDLASNLRFLGLLPWYDDEKLRIERSMLRAANSTYKDKSVTANDIRQLQKRSFNFSELDHSIEARLAARKAKNFKESDRIRDELLAQGIVLKDGPAGTTWEVKK